MSAPVSLGQRRVELGAQLAILAAAALVLSPFAVPITWAAILAYASWPLFVRLERALGGRTGLAAPLMTLAIVLIVLVPAVLLSVALAAEVHRMVAEGGPGLPLGAMRDAVVEALRRVPVVGPTLADRLLGLWASPAAIQQWVVGQLGGLAAALGSAAGGLGRGGLDTLLTLLTLGFFYREGGHLGPKIRGLVGRLGGPGLQALLQPMGETVRAVMYGTLLTALAQGLLVGLGLWVAGVRAPVLLGALAALLGLTPVGAPLVYVSAAGALLLQGRILAGLLLLAWGVVVVSSVDNVIRSWFLSGAVRIPFLLGLFGILGGLLAFGTVGAFLGPAVIGLALTLWRQWAPEP
jgi:predicted PurR-regulated permease PerM